MLSQCKTCKMHVKEWNLDCASCGYKLELVPTDKLKARYLHGPSVGSIFFTQAWTLGARLPLLFIGSLIPIVGVVVAIVGLVFGRRLSWTHGGWKDWESFQKRMKLLDIISYLWIALLLGIYLYARQR